MSACCCQYDLEKFNSSMLCCTIYQPAWLLAALVGRPYTWSKSRWNCGMVAYWGYCCFDFCFSQWDLICLHIIHINFYLVYLVFIVTVIISPISVMCNMVLTHTRTHSHAHLNKHTVTCPCCHPYLVSWNKGRTDASPGKYLSFL